MKLSIVTINRNNLEGLKKTMKSVLAQVWTDYEWIIIDGASTDGSREYIESEYSRLSTSGINPITYWCSEKDNGIYNALNKGIRHCQGEYISCMNSGDEFYAFDTLCKVFEKERKEDVLYGNAFVYKGTLSRVSVPPAYMDIHAIFYKFICHQAMFVKTSLLLRHPFDEKYDICADYACWLKLVLEGCSFLYLNQIICKFDGSGFSSVNSERLREQKVLIQSELLPTAIRNAIVEYHNYVPYIPFLCQIREILDYGGRSAFILRKVVRLLFFMKRVKRRMVQIKCFCKCKG